MPSPMPDPEPVRHFTLGGLLHKNIIIKKHWPFAPALTAAKYACCNSARDTGTYIYPMTAGHGPLFRLSDVV